MAAENDASSVRTETLLRTSSAWNNAPYRRYPEGIPELTVLRITVPAHGELPWHRHPMPNAAYIVSGEITIEGPGGQPRHFSAGQVIPETVDTLHRGMVGDKPAEFLVFYAGVQGKPLSVQKP
jgi:quercetin dioxygenase-like cupin family protein